MKGILTLILTMFFVQSFAQNNAIMGEKDTLTYNYYSGGVFDSIDIAFSPHSSTLPGGGFSTSENTLPYNFFLNNYGGTIYHNFNDWKTKRFSAMPHLGFGYVFGMQATQQVKATYTHAFTSQTLLNIDYTMLKGTNFLRSGDFGKHDVQLQFEFQSRFYSLDVKGQFMSRNIKQNDGVQADSLIDYYGLAFTPIRKENAQSKYRGTRIELSHYFDFLSKDSNNAMGLYIDNKMNIFNRKYYEFSDTLQSIYSYIYLNTDTTNDQYQLSELVNVAGLFYSRNRLFFKVGAQNNWWNYYNLGNHIAQSEINLDGHIGMNFKLLSFRNNTNFNLIGAEREWFSFTNLKLHWKGISLDANANVSYLLPEPFQRYYLGNNLFYNLMTNKIDKQFKLDINALVKYTFKQHQIGVFVNNATVTNNYWFKNNTWVNDTLKSLNAFSVGLTGRTGYKVIFFDLKGSYNTSNWMPSMLVQGRLYLQGRLFKGKKLLAQIGVESSYHTGYKLVEHLPYMDIFSLTSVSSKAMANLHVFGAFEIQRFRFFFRVENLGYFWSDKTTRIALNQTIPSMNIRIGITWDFFN
ncbi:MAG: putative porin [Crocinitomicaceae bacterium]|nr:putative porin [Crocinitomicaceae bacterium]